MELKQRQLEQRKADEISRHQKARNIIEENRMRVALQSEMVANGDYLDQEYKDQINCILGDQFGSIDEKLRLMSAERDLVENDEEHLIKQMDIDTKKAIIELHEERERQKIQNELQLVDEVYKDYLIKKHPNYPKAKSKIVEEESKPDFDNKDYYNFKQLKKTEGEPQAQHKIDTLGKLDKLQATTIRELDFYNQRQTELNKKLEEQQRVLQAVQNDINKREQLLNFVFDHRRKEEDMNALTKS